MALRPYKREGTPVFLEGVLRAPGDKSISHRALLFAALANGTTYLEGLSLGEDVLGTRSALCALGAEIASSGTSAMVEGGIHRLSEPRDVIYVGNSGTLIRLLSGIVAGVKGMSVLSGDASVNSRPMARVTEPLSLMGARIYGRQGGRFAPLVVIGGTLKGIEYEIPVPSAQVKSALMLGALRAEGETVIKERIGTRRHSEEFFELLSIPHQISAYEEGSEIRIQPGAELQPFSLSVPADPSQAAFFIVGALLLANSELEVSDVYLGPCRAEFLEVLRGMGADIQTHSTFEGYPNCGTIQAKYSQLSATEISGVMIPGLIDEIPILALAGAFSHGVTVIRDASELRAKESDRIETTVAMLKEFQIEVESSQDGLVIYGNPAARESKGTAKIQTKGDHRIAMAAVIGSLVFGGTTEIDDVSCISTSYPSFFEDLELLST